jgi:hypothetical protein
MACPILPGPLDTQQNEYIGRLLKCCQQFCVQWTCVPTEDYFDASRAIQISAWHLLDVLHSFYSFKISILGPQCSMIYPCGRQNNAISHGNVQFK